MAQQKKDRSKSASIEVQTITRKSVRLYVMGDSPLICNAMSEKAKHELLFPSRRKTATQRQGILKHDPIEEYRGSIYRMGEGEPTLIGLLSTSFKNAMRGAAVDLEGATKAQLGRLAYVEGDMVGIFGIPELHMSVVRQAGMNRTPDIRTRAILPHWACVVDITFTAPMLTQKACVDLFAAAGCLQGVGDWRVEKGSGSYGRFSVVSKDHKGFQKIVEVGGREAQIQAMEEPDCYDEETRKLFSWFNEELIARGADETSGDEKDDTEVAA